MAGMGRKNDYLSWGADNKYHVDPMFGIEWKPFPEGEERERINKAFDSLIAALGQNQVLAKAKFWQWAATIPMNERQIKVLNRLLDGFEGKLTTRKWAALAKCSQDTALRDIKEMLQHNVLQKTAAGGRSTHYEVCHFGEESEVCTI